MSADHSSSSSALETISRLLAEGVLQAPKPVNLFPVQDTVEVQLLGREEYKLYLRGQVRLEPE